MKKLGVLIVTFGLMVSGCSEDVDLSVSADVEAEEVSVISSTDMIYEIVYAYNDYAITTYEDVMNSKVTTANKDEYIKMTTDFLNYMNGIDTYSLGINDEVLEEYVWDFDHHATTYAEYVLKYLNSGDTSYKSFIEDYYKSVLDDLTLIQSILEPTN